ncbi:LacI family DNA-binding transcriptional regulator [Psychroserpens sp. Hel_I_66]|uniref:LacI family DNA-binding transcriptional regulator n=1 Tax=Psychroserpens sp. Hel_I_66 TaxID=1250004 RepID=UPI00064828C3|nr:LacI family DNA-binding transcriptional regulator [Psychroserpens sp. Hel_I_66]
MPAITLKEISRVSGYSVSTVSKALNDKSDINIETRQLIKNIANKYNYIPNNFAVALRKKKTKVIAVIVPQVNTFFCSSHLYNIQKIAYAQGYRIVLFQTLMDVSKERESINQSKDGSFDGTILITNNIPLVNFSEENNSTTPIEFIKIDDSLPQDQLKKDSILSFNKLLRRIN